ncbi:MAG: hypothetical protein U0R52_07675 [Solirubrobacterales bacterium]
MIAQGASAVKPTRRRAAILGSLLAAAVSVLALSAPGASAARVKCPGTFHVLHNDHIGRLSLPAGRYQVTILKSGTPSCQAASTLFARFLQDFDGKLPNGYRVSVAKRAFVQRPGVGFAVTRLGGGGGGGGGGGHHHPQGGSFCPGTFQVLHNDHIGKLQLPKGRYWIILLQRNGLSCSRASQLFTKFLADPSGKLPAPWRVYPPTAKFRRGPGGNGFRVKPAG